MKIKRSILIISFVMLTIISINLIKVNAAYNCAIENDPNVLTTCFQLDFTSIILGIIKKIRKKEFISVYI
jgi:hypothetical protein